MKVRKANMDDFNQISKISTQVHNIHVELRPDIYLKVDNSLDGRYVEILKNKIILVIEEQEILGYAICQIKDNSLLQIKGKKLDIEEFGIKENSRRKGIGKKFFEEIKEFAKDNNCREIVLTAQSNNFNALKFYENIGFTPRAIKLEMKI